MLGVLGGMGPAATIDFMAKVVALTDAARDQDHIPMVVTSIPQIPDRTSAILHNGEDPLPAMLRCVDVLQRADASMIAIPCNTAHFWYPQIADYARIPVLNIVEACAHELRSGQSGASRVGLMATAGTLASGIYQRSLTEFEIRLPEDQGVVTQGIAAVKAGELEAARLLLEQVADDLFRDQCDAIIMACTEIPLALAERAKRAPSQYIDPTNALAKMSVSHWSKRAELAPKREDKEQYVRA